MPINDSWYTSNNQEWETPDSLYNELDREFNFDIDVCATAENTKHGKHWSLEQDGLKQNWKGLTCWMNPPYGRRVSDWLSKALKESSPEHLVVALLPARTDTVWFHKYVYGKAEIRLLKGRLKFSINGNEGTAPFPSMVVVFRGEGGIRCNGRRLEQISNS